MNDKHKLLSQVDILAFETMFQNKNKVKIDATPIIEEWASAKASNDAIFDLFKDELVIGVPIQPQTLMKLDETEKREKRNDIERLLKGNNYWVTKALLENSIYDEDNDTWETVAMNNLLNGEFESDYSRHKCSVIWFLRFETENIINSFFNSQGITDFPSQRKPNIKLHGERGVEFKQQKSEPTYRYVLRYIKKFLNRYDNIAEDYNSLLIKWSKRKNFSSNSQTLCLSIHPRDYVLASYGNSWSTCFESGGAYAASQSSTLISRDTIVAYTLPTKEYELAKKDESLLFKRHWRSFITINPQHLLMIKGYPTTSPALFEAIDKMIEKRSKFKYTWHAGRDYYSDEITLEHVFSYIDVDTAAVDKYDIGSLFVNMDAPDYTSDYEFDFATKPFLWDSFKSSLEYDDVFGEGIAVSKTMFEKDLLHEWNVMDSFSYDELMKLTDGGTPEDLFQVLMSKAYDMVRLDPDLYEGDIADTLDEVQMDFLGEERLSEMFADRILLHIASVAICEMP